MRGHVALRLIHNLSVVLYASAQKPLVDFRFLEHQRLALLVVGNGIVVDPAVHGRWLRMRRQIPAQIFNGHQLWRIIRRNRSNVHLIQLLVDALQQFRNPPHQTRNHFKSIFFHIRKVFHKGRSFCRYNQSGQSQFATLKLRSLALVPSSGALSRPSELHLWQLHCETLLAAQVRSGQGVDNIYLDTLSEGKPAPDYTKTDDFCVTLILSSRIEDAAFSQFINAIQDSLPDDAKLTVYDVLTLNTIRQTKSRQSLDKKIVTKLLKAGYIEQRGRTSGTYYILGKDYYEMSGKLSEYFNLTDWDESQVLSIVASFLKKNKTAKMGDFANLFIGHLSRKQIRSYIEKLVENGMLSFAGDGKMRTYSLSKSYESQMALITKAVEIGLNEMSKQAKDQKKGQ